MRRRMVLLVGAVIAAIRIASADVVILKNGDRLTGRAAEIGDKVGIQTDYGYILLKKDAIAEIQKQPMPETASAVDPALYDRLVDMALNPAGNSSVRQDAMRQLAALDGKRAIPVLVKLACEEEKNSSIISSAITAVAAIEEENAPPILFGILWSARDPVAVRYVINALSRTGVGKEPLIRFCAELVQRKDDLRAQINAAYALSSLGQLLGAAALASIADDEKADLETRIKAVELMPRQGVPLRTNVLLQVALDPKQDRELRLRAIKCLTSGPRDRTVADALGKIVLDAEDEEIQQIAAETLRRSGDKTAVAAYAKLARRGLNPKIRKTAVAILADIDDPVAVQGLRDVLLDPQEDMSFRLLALDALKSLRSPQVNEAFMELAAAVADDWRLRLRAAGALRRRDKGLGDAALNVIAQNLLLEDPGNALAVLRETIANAKDSQLLGAAVEILKSGKIKVNAVDMLWEMVLQAARNYRSADDELVAKNAGEALALLDAPASAKLFSANLLEAGDFPTKKVMCVALGALADPAGIPALKDVALRPEENAEVTQCAAHSICRIALSPAVEAIRELEPNLHDATARKQVEAFLQRTESCWVPPGAQNVMRHLCDMVGSGELRFPVTEALEMIWNGPARLALIEVMEKTSREADREMILLFFYQGKFRKPELVASYERLAVSAAGPAARFHAINALWSLGNEKAYDFMEDYIADPEAAYSQGKKAFISALKQARRKSTIPALVACLEDGTASIVSQAAKTLTELTGEDFGRLPAPTAEANEATIRKWHEWLARQGTPARPRKQPLPAQAPRD